VEKNMKFNLIGFALALAFFSNASFATEYIYRDLMANTLPSIKCESTAKAKLTAEKPYKLRRYAKNSAKHRAMAGGLKKLKIMVKQAVMNAPMIKPYKYVICKML